MILSEVLKEMKLEPFVHILVREGNVSTILGGGSPSSVSRRFGTREVLSSLLSGDGAIIFIVSQL